MALKSHDRRHVGKVPIRPLASSHLFGTASVFSFNATKEVILSAGAINTPQLLLLSGIGPPSPLADLGIEQTVNLPAVGQQLADHLLVANQFEVAAPQDDLLEAIRRNETLFNDLLSEWEQNKQGAMTNGPSNHIGWLRVPEDEQGWTADEDPSAGPTSPHYELLFVVCPLHIYYQCMVLKTA